MSENEYVLKRGDLIQFVGSTDDFVGQVLGWIDKDTVVVQRLPEKTIVALFVDENVELLAKREELKDLDALPAEIKISDTRPS